MSTLQNCASRAVGSLGLHLTPSPRLSPCLQAHRKIHTIIDGLHRPARTRAVRLCAPTPLTLRRTFTGRLERSAINSGCYKSYASVAAADQKAVVHHVYEPKTGSWQYIVADSLTAQTVVIDPVLDFDAVTTQITTQTADALLAIIHDNKYHVSMILETHAHADHLTAAYYLQQQLAHSQEQSPRIGIGKRICDVQKFWAGKFQIPTEEYQNAFDKLFDDDETFPVGSLRGTAIHLPGHTPDHMGYLIADNVFVGDSMFNPDLGSARADFPGGDARMLFRSGRKLLTLPEHVKIWSGHDYPPDDQKGRMPWMTVRDQRETNKHLKLDIHEDEYVTMRRQRDATLAEPTLLYQALQINIRAGRLPPPSASGLRMMLVPLKVDSAQW